MSEQTQETGMSRRGFLKAAALTTTAAAATGAGIAYVSSEFAGPAAVPTPANITAPVSAPAVAAPAVSPVTAQSELLSQLTAAQAENMRLQAALDAATREVDSLRQIQSQPNEALEILQADLSSANGQITALAGLVGLYEQLDKLDIGEKIVDRMGDVSEAFTELVDELPTLEEGLAFGEEMLDEFEAQIPLLETGRSWLATHLSNLDDYYVAFEQVLQEAAERVAPVLDMLQEWFDKILKWLPFGFGQTSVRVMAAVTNLIRETPKTVQEGDLNLAQPMDMWFKKTDGENETPLQKRLFKPLREQTIAKAHNTAVKTNQVKTLYDEQLVTRVSSDIESKRLIQKIIADYREKNQI